MIVLISACTTEKDCDHTDCYVDTKALKIALLNMDSGENMVSNGSIDTSGIYIMNADFINVDFIFSKDLEAFEIPDITSIAGTQLYQMFYNDELLMSFRLKVEEEVVDCCSQYQLKSFSVSNWQYDFSQGNYLAQVYISIEE